MLQGCLCQQFLSSHSLTLEFSAYRMLSFEHEPESVLENEAYKILWDFSNQIDHVIEARRPDLVLVDNNERSCKIIDLAVPGDSRIEENEKDKIEKYQDLGRELQKIWNVKVKIIPLVVGSLDAIPKQFGNRLKQIGITAAQVQKTVLLETARILRKVLKSKAAGCGLISTVISSIVLLCVSSIIII